MTPDDALAQLTALANPEKAAEMAAYHKAPRPYLGITVPDITALAATWRDGTDTGQRVAIAAMLAQDTPLLLLDEPANALDLAHQSAVTRLLVQLCREQGKTIVAIGHDLNLAHQASTHALLLMGDGEWLAGPVEQTMSAPLLSRYLDHPIEVLQHGARGIFISSEG